MDDARPPTILGQMHRSHLAGLLVALAALGACARRAPDVDTSPYIPARAADVVRTVADSIYVPSTKGGPIAIVAVELDSTCGGPARAGDSWCPQLPTLWQVDPVAWLAPGTAADSAEVRSAHRSLLAQRGERRSLASAAFGSPSLLAVAPEDIPTPWDDYDVWTAFREEHRGAAGFVRFSPVGFGRSGRTALVLVEWRCGPTCGHLTAVSLAATDGGWRIADMLLVASRR